MKITSPAFTDNDYIPRKFSCIGGGINPELRIDNIPAEAKTLVLIMDDPDAPVGTYVHWVVYNIPLLKTILEDSVPGEEGIGTSGKRGYFPPCPPYGTHHYFFKIYALDCGLRFKKPPSKQEVEAAMEGHVLDKAELIGLFSKA